jgi:nucleotide-binding universal stress UspA family protein
MRKHSRAVGRDTSAVEHNRISRKPQMIGGEHPMAAASARDRITETRSVLDPLERYMPNPIIAGVDPRRQDDSPLRLAAALSRATGQPLVAVATYPRELTATRTSTMFEGDLRADAAAQLERLAAGVQAELLVVGGPSPARALHDTAVARGASMIVVGSTHRGRIGRVAPGSTAERLLHGAPCAVAIATPDLPEDWAPRRVGMGFVDLEEGHEALRAAAGLAHAAGASLRALTAVEPLEWGQSATIAPYRAEGGLESWKTAARHALDTALESVPPGISATAEVVVGHTVDALVTLSGDVDLVVCGSRGYGPLRSVLLGGVTHRLTREAHCPVVVVPRGVEGSLHSVGEEREATAP